MCVIWLYTEADVEFRKGMGPNTKTWHIRVHEFNFLSLIMVFGGPSKGSAGAPPPLDPP